MGEFQHRLQWSDDDKAGKNETTSDSSVGESSIDLSSQKIAAKDVIRCSNTDLIQVILGKKETPPVHSDYWDGLVLKLPESRRATVVAKAEGLTENEIVTVAAAVELGRRVSEAKSLVGKRDKMSSTAVAVSYCMEKFKRLVQDGNQEEFHIVTLDTKNCVIDTHLVSKGTLDASLVHPREVFRPAILDSASSIIAVHNHPSGDPTPSKEDIAVTKRLEQSGKTLGIDVLDHIVVAAQGGRSIREIS